jgi:2-dehydro-3-deoxyphosphogluconate aldolase/(4S)-4-hydroxy-2-oxoglutarate aldolase
VALDDIGEYFAAGAAAVGVGGELIRRDLVRAGDFSAIAALATRYVDAVRAVRQQAPVRSDRP